MNHLKEIAKQVRRITLKSIHAAKSGHPGGSLSCVELLVYLYHHQMQPQPYNPLLPQRDIFVMSKGHACPSLYATWVTLGLISESDVMGLRKLDSPFQGHPSVTNTTFAETSTGSLGQGLAFAVGAAMALKFKQSSHKVYCLIGEGDFQEGMAHECFMIAAHHHLDNLVVILDHNGLQSDDFNDNILGINMVNNKMMAYNWLVESVLDGHDLNEIAEVFDYMVNIEINTIFNQPVLINVFTTKGKGVSYMEESPLWHGSVTMTDQQLQDALGEL